MLDSVNQLIPSINRVLSGEQQVQVSINIPTKDMVMLGGILFLSMFAAVLLALLVTKN